MLLFKELRLRNYVLFDGQDFPFENGLTQVGGRNRTGKSLVFSPLKSLLFGVDRGYPLPKGSHVELDLVKLNAQGKRQHISIHADTPKNRPDWNLYINKQDVKAHRKSTVRELIDSRVGISEDLFSTICHLQSNSLPPLSYGTPANRLDWLSSVFNLAGIYTSVEKEVSQKLLELRDKKVKLDTLRSMLPERIEKPDLEEINRLRKLKHASDKKIQKLASISRLRQKQSSLEYLLATVSKLRLGIHDLESLEKEKSELTSKINRYEDLLRLAEDYDREHAKFLLASKKLNVLGKNLRNIPRSKKECHEWIDIATKEIEKIESSLLSSASNNKAYYNNQRILDKMRGMKKPNSSQKDLENALAILRSQKSAANKILDSNENKIDTTCPECGSQLTKGHIRKVHAKQIDLLEGYKAKINSIKEQLLWYEYEGGLKSGVEFTDTKKLKSRRKELLFKKKSLMDILPLIEVKKPIKPKMFPSNKKMNNLKSRLQDVVHDISLIKSLATSDLKSRKYYEDKLERLKVSLKGVKDNEDIVKDSLKIREDLSNLENNLRQYNAYREKKNALYQDIQILKQECFAIRPLTALKEAFGRGGLILDAMNDGIAALLNEINKLVPMLFDEKFKVDIVTGPRKLEVLIERNGSKESIRTLSNSEFRCWTLLFSAALRRLLPPNMLTDTIILDEMEAHMDKQSKKRYATEFVPYLLTMVPKVIVISPLIATNELPLNPDRTFLAKKENNRSTLVMS